jgi:hypothetical protein
MKCQVRNLKATLTRNYKFSQNQEEVSALYMLFILLAATYLAQQWRRGISVINGKVFNTYIVDSNRRKSTMQRKAVFCFRRNSVYSNVPKYYIVHSLPTF